VPELYKYGINTVTFSHGSKNSWDLECRHWILLQEEIFKRWRTFFRRSKCWTYWKNISVAVHMFDFGGNNTITLSSNKDDEYDVEYIQTSLERLTKLENIERVTFALATEVQGALDHTDGTKHGLSLVGDVQKIRDQYFEGNGLRDLYIYPIGF